MDITREAVEDWLSTHKRGRQWLADKCGVGVAAVGHWLKKSDPRPIPSKAIVIIKNLIAEDEAQKEATKQTPQNLVLEFSHEDFEKLEQAALKDDSTTRAWAKKTLLDAAYEDMEKLAARIAPSIAAEQPAQYKVENNIIHPEQDQEVKQNKNGGEANTNR